jgi:hypothetical protein
VEGVRRTSFAYPGEMSDRHGRLNRRVHRFASSEWLTISNPKYHGNLRWAVQNGPSYNPQFDNRLSIRQSEVTRAIILLTSNDLLIKPAIQFVYELIFVQGQAGLRLITTL